MNRTWTIFFLDKQNLFYLILLISVLITLNSCDKKETYQRPNIIFIMADDHAYQAISAYDTNLIQTPNIDRLADEGMRFDQAFVTNSICSPSRAVILTGKHSHLNGVRNNMDIFDSTQQTFPKLLQQSGYETAIVGKWHLKSQPTGFDFWNVLPGQGYYNRPQFKTLEGVVEKEGYVTNIITDISIDWLETRKQTAKPFMLMIHHKAPHREWVPPPENLKDMKDQAYPESSTLFDDYSGRGTAAKDAEMRILEHMGYTNDNKIPPGIMNELGLTEFSQWYQHAYQNNYKRMTPEEQLLWDSVYDPKIAKFIQEMPKGDDLIRWKFQRYLEDYLATIKSVDDNVGRLLKYLEESGLDKNTLVVYTSDQGFYLGEHGWFDKRFMYKESFRTPLLIRWTDQIKPGQVNTNLVQNLDLAETFLDIAGIYIPEDMQGKSLLPLLKNKENFWRESIYYHYYEYPGIHAVKRHYGIRTNRYKLIHFYYDIDEWEMYDLEKDPLELNNVIKEIEYEEIKNELMVKLLDLKTQYHDSDTLSDYFIQKDLNR